MDIYINYTRCKAEFFTLALAFYYAGIEKLDFSIYFCSEDAINCILICKKRKYYD